MFILLEDETTKRRILLNLESTFAVLEGEDGAAEALSIGGHRIPLGTSFDAVQDELGEAEDAPRDVPDVRGEAAPAAGPRFSR